MGGGDGGELTLGGELPLGTDFGTDNGLLGGGSGSASEPASDSGLVAFGLAETEGAADGGGAIGFGSEDAATPGLEGAASELLPTRPPSVAATAELGRFTGLV